MNNHRWTFTSRFRAGAYGWKSSQLACKRVKEAVSEIKKVARKDQTLAAEGAVKLLGRIAPAFQDVDTSSGALGAAVNNAVLELATVIGNAPLTPSARNKLLDQLWQALVDDAFGYIDICEEVWGEMCGSPETAADWAEKLRPAFLSMLEPGGRYIPGYYAFLSCLLSAQRYDELLEQIARIPRPSWSERAYGVRALVCQGKKAEAIRYAEASTGINVDPLRIAQVCEEILLSSGFADDAYARYALAANRKNSQLATFRAIAKKYPGVSKETILSDLIRSTPGEEGKWFATAKDLGMFDLALDLANTSPCAHTTLCRAARDFPEKEPEFALGAAQAALRWLLAGKIYETDTIEVGNAVTLALLAGERLGRRDEVVAWLNESVAAGVDKFVVGALRERLKRV